MGAPENYTYVVYLDEKGKVITGEPAGGGSLEYDVEEREFKKSIEGAYLYTPNGCCWRLVQGVWKCRKRYCK